MVPCGQSKINQYCSQKLIHVVYIDMIHIWFASNQFIVSMLCYVKSTLLVGVCVNNAY